MILTPLPARGPRGGREDVAHGDDDFLHRIAVSHPSLSPQMAHLAAFVGG
jgi:hypothetical protein